MIGHAAGARSGAARWSALLSLLATALLVAVPSAAVAQEGTWEPTRPLNVPRLNPTATLLADGRVLVAGGRTFTFTTSLTSAELYDPISEQFTLTDSMATARWSHTARSRTRPDRR